MTVSDDNITMHVDHLVYAAGPKGLTAEAERLGALLGQEFKDGGFHPRFGTRNHILPFADGRYMEIVEVLDHPAAEKAVYGQAVRERSSHGGGWLGWVVSVEDIAPIEQRLERRAVPGARRFPDGRVLEWEQIGIKGLMADPQLPYFIKWISPADVQPKALGGEISIDTIEIGGSPDRVADWIGHPIGEQLDGVKFKFGTPHGHPGIDAVVFNTKNGLVRI